MNRQASTTLAGRYRLEREIGAGGMATVYLAEDIKHSRQVAVKVLHPELAAQLGHERFLREITTTANLRHPNILPLFDTESYAAHAYPRRRGGGAVREASSAKNAGAVYSSRSQAETLRSNERTSPPA